jgi:hypothetical protein
MRKLIKVSSILMLLLVAAHTIELGLRTAHLSVVFYDERRSPGNETDEQRGEILDADAWIADEHACPRAIPGTTSPPYDHKRIGTGTTTRITHHLVDHALSTVKEITALLEAVFIFNPSPVALHRVR